MEARVQMAPIPGRATFNFAAGEMLTESRRFAWLPRYLPVIDQHHTWDGKTYRFVWLRRADFVGTRFGWEAIREARPRPLHPISGGSDAEPTTAPADAGNAGAPIQDVAYEQWSAAVPEKYRGDDYKSYWEALKGKPLSGVLQNYAEGQRHFSGSIRIPGKEAKPEEWDAFYGKLGRPASPDAYTTAVTPSPMPDGLTWNDKMLQGAYAAFHKAGLTPAQAQQMLDHYASVAMAGHDAEKQKQGGALANAEKIAAERLTEAWGAPGSPTYQRNTGLARAGIRAAAGDLKLSPDEVREIEDFVLKHDAELARYAAWVGDKLTERGFEKGDVSAAPDQAQAQAQIRSMYADKNHPMHHPEHPRYREALAERDRIFKLAYGTQDFEPASARRAS